MTPNPTPQPTPERAQPMRAGDYITKEPCDMTNEELAQILQLPGSMYPITYELALKVALERLNTALSVASPLSESGATEGNTDLDYDPDDICICEDAANPNCKVCFPDPIDHVETILACMQYVRWDTEMMDDVCTVPIDSLKALLRRNHE